MSRIGKQTITIPDKTEIEVGDGTLRVKGPKGEISRSVHSEIKIEVKDKEVHVAKIHNSRLARALWGSYASHIVNMIQGVHEPFRKQLVVEGIGYRVELSGKTLKLSVGYSHPVTLAVPEGIQVSVEKNVISIEGVNKELVGQFAANVRAVKKPEPYKGKGIRYEGEVVRRKQGKKSV